MVLDQNGSLQQYAEIPKQKHAGGFRERTLKPQRTLFNHKEKLKIRKEKLKKEN
ncbi:hypothetical protein J4G07_03105 [Candidatus Poribacteria bacterium]|nr:hypothetical protein [Candidatus Poribacteria bacterium]